jgi:hypothetical protein
MILCANFAKRDLPYVMSKLFCSIVGTQFAQFSQCLHAVCNVCTIFAQSMHTMCTKFAFLTNHKIVLNNLMVG